MIDAAPGAIGAACYPNATCNTALACVRGICVPEALGGEADSGIATAAAAVAGSPAPSTVTGPATAPVDTDPDSAPF